MPGTDDAMPPGDPFAIAINCMWPCELVPAMKIITGAIHDETEKTLSTRYSVGSKCPQMSSNTLC